MDRTGIVLLLRQGELMSIGQSEKSYRFLGSRRDLLLEHGAEGDPLGTCSETGKAQMLPCEEEEVVLVLGVGTVDWVENEGCARSERVWSRKQEWGLNLRLSSREGACGEAAKTKGREVTFDFAERL